MKDKYRTKQDGQASKYVRQHVQLFKVSSYKLRLLSLLLTIGIVAMVHLISIRYHDYLIFKKITAQIDELKSPNNQEVSDSKVVQSSNTERIINSVPRFTEDTTELSQIEVPLAKKGLSSDFRSELNDLNVEQISNTGLSETYKMRPQGHIKLPEKAESSSQLEPTDSLKLLYSIKEFRNSLRIPATQGYTKHRIGLFRKVKPSTKQKVVDSLAEQYSNTDPSDELTLVSHLHIPLSTAAESLRQLKLSDSLVQRHDISTDGPPNSSYPLIEPINSSASQDVKQTRISVPGVLGAMRENRSSVRYILRPLDSKKLSQDSRTDLVELKLQTYHQNIKNIYLNALKVDPTLGGFLTVRFGINKQGFVTDVEILDSSINSSNFAFKISEAIKNWDFRKLSESIGNTDWTILYTFRSE